MLLKATGNSKFYISKIIGIINNSVPPQPNS